MFKMSNRMYNIVVIDEIVHKVLERHLLQMHQYTSAYEKWFVDLSYAPGKRTVWHLRPLSRFLYFVDVNSSNCNNMVITECVLIINTRLWVLHTNAFSISNIFYVHNIIQAIPKPTYAGFIIYDDYYQIISSYSRCFVIMDDLCRFIIHDDYYKIISSYSQCFVIMDDLCRFTIYDDYY